jgi:hypothetical protein
LVDRDGQTRKIDITFVLHTWAVDILVTVECKSHATALTLDEVDQLKVYKHDIPTRNVFWLVTDGHVSSSAAEALKSAGIAIYHVQELEDIVGAICRDSRSLRILGLRRLAARFSRMSHGTYGRLALELKDREGKLLRSLLEARAVHSATDGRIVHSLGDSIISWRLLMWLTTAGRVIVLIIVVTVVALVCRSCV